ncbi:Scarecrow-like protein 14 isoform D [Glycine soja]|nr:Scarecrow-like protein 14 isoform D [Glycine soja]
MDSNFPGASEDQGTPYLSDSLGFATMEDNDFSETAKFISQILMEENVDQKPFYDSLTLQVTEKSFYDALAGNLPLSPDQHPVLLSPEAETTTTTTTSSSSSSSNNNFSDEYSRELKLRSPDSISVSAFQFKSQPPPSVTVSDAVSDLDSSIAKLLAHNIFNHVDSVSQFRRGFEEASKFLPPGPNLVTALHSKREEPINSFGDNSYGLLKGRKNHQRQEIETREEGEGERSNKQSALSLVDESDLSDAFDRLLLHEGNLCDEHIRLTSGSVNVEERDGGKGRSKKQGRRKKETVDLRNLLLMCSQSVYANDNRTANELLKQIRQHSSPVGDASQRLAHYFTNGLEARLVGDGTSAQGMYTFLSSKNITVAEFLKAYQVFTSSSPFKKFIHFFANKMIMKAAAKAETVHIIDFGILYGFQWPILIKFFSNREGGPPKLRITGIEFPQPGFRPAERIEETGHRLANYCKRYNVPFEYNAIASKNWENIQVEALKIQSNELVAVNCHLRFENLLDESIEVNSPRNGVLHLIRKINPDIFTQSITNGSYNAPFFATRFREALFHYSAIYDLIDTVIPRENEWRLMLERELLGREIMNVIACEGSERIERPETYKQWYVRNTRAGFKQLPLNEELMAKFRTKLKEWYHRDFVFDEDNKWMLQVLIFPVRASSYTPTGALADYLSLEIFQLVAMVKLILLVTLFQINPDIFTQSITSGSYNAPFLSTRFREALFHYSGISDKIDTVIPRKNDRRLMVERELLGREIMNFIACEGSERIERPETYKQWQVRNMKAGFKQLPLDEELMAKFRSKLKEYHRDFVLDENNNWMLQACCNGEAYFAGYNVSSSDILGLWLPTFLTFRVKTYFSVVGFGEDDGIAYLSDSLGFATMEDNDFSETAKFISQILMEENVELEQSPFYDSLTLQVTEKSFYDALAGNLLLSPQASNTNFSVENSRELNLPSPDSLSVSALQFNPHALSQPPPLVNVSEGVSDLDSSIARLLAHNIFNDVDSVSHFRRGFEEASRFLPPGPNLVTALHSNAQEPINSFRENSYGLLKGRKNLERQEINTREEERGGRSNKQSAFSFVDESDLSDAIDRVFLSVENVCSEHSSLQSGPLRAEEQDRGKGLSKKQERRKQETVDLRNLLLMCSQSVYANDNRTANELLKQIRQHSSPVGDASQRLAHYFANGLEARLVGDGTSSQGMYTFLSSKNITAAEFLKTHQDFMSASPFKKFTYFFANKMIMKAAAKVETVHIIDFGILYGFQWPILIKFLSNREGGPPKLRITGIEFPQPGFRPTEKIDETGRRLANYCKRYSVPFEYNAIASKNWETIRIEALKIESNELVAVNCHQRFENLLDDSIEVNSPRNAVLHLIRKINPNIFTQSITNGSYNAPFFAPRFREALFHYSAIYDLIDTIIHRENERRLMIERELLGREIMNVIACEGSERIERPETYKQWQVRNMKAGFKQLPLDEELMAKFRTELRKWYHRDFVSDEDSNWMLLGWKGRILFASTCWVPA